MKKLAEKLNRLANEVEAGTKSKDKALEKKLTAYAIKQFPQAEEMSSDPEDRALILAATVGMQAVRLKMTQDQVSRWFQSAYSDVWVKRGRLNPGADAKDVRKEILKAMTKAER